MLLLLLFFHSYKKIPAWRRKHIIERSEIISSVGDTLMLKHLRHLSADMEMLVDTQIWKSWRKPGLERVSEVIGLNRWDMKPWKRFHWDNEKKPRMNTNIQEVGKEKEPPKWTGSFGATYKWFNVILEVKNIKSWYPCVDMICIMWWHINIGKNTHIRWVCSFIHSQ